MITMIDGLTAAYGPSFPPSAASRVPGPAASTPVYQAIDQLFDLSRESRNVLGSVFEMDPESRQRFLEMTANLLKSGVVGFELFDTGSRNPHQSYLLARSADDPLRQARPYREPAGNTSRRIDLRG